MEKANETIFVIKTELVLNVPANQPVSLKEVSYNLEMPAPGSLQKSAYLDKDQMPTSAGVKMIANAFVQGLAANIQAGDNMGLWHREDHLQWLHRELDRAIAAGGEKLPGEQFFKT